MIYMIKDKLYNAINHQSEPTLSFKLKTALC